MSMTCSLLGTITYIPNRILWRWFSLFFEVGYVMLVPWRYINFRGMQPNPNLIREIDMRWCSRKMYQKFGSVWSVLNPNLKSNHFYWSFAIHSVSMKWVFLKSFPRIHCVSASYRASISLICWVPKSKTSSRCCCLLGTLFWSMNCSRRWTLDLTLPIIEYRYNNI